MGSVLPVLPVHEPPLSWENDPGLDGHPDGWAVLRVLPLSNSLSKCRLGGGRSEYELAFEYLADKCDADGCCNQNCNQDRVG
jgi:hypothetical protein